LLQRFGALLLSGLPGGISVPLADGAISEVLYLDALRARSVAAAPCVVSVIDASQSTEAAFFARKRGGSNPKGGHDQCAE
jgi:hypothetical protein